MQQQRKYFLKACTFLDLRYKTLNLFSKHEIKNFIETEINSLKTQKSIREITENIEDLPKINNTTTSTKILKKERFYKKKIF